MQKITKYLPKKPTEDVLAQTCVRWFRLQYPQWLIHHSANEGKKHVRFAVKLKAIGLLAGFPDFLVIRPDKIFFIELKRDPKMQNHKFGGLSAEQMALHGAIRALGFSVFTAYSFDDFCQICRSMT